MRFLLAMAAMLALGGCSGGLAELKALNPQASDFDSSLAAEYLAYADSESELGHPLIAGHFASKGLAAHRHETVLPDRPDETQMAQVDVRPRLLAALTDDVKHVAPQKAARAQLLYDCWLSQSRDPSRAGLAPCGDEFGSAMNELQAVADNFVFGQELSHSIAFEPGSAALSAKGSAEIYAIAQHSKGMANYDILLTDHAEHKPQSLLLAQRRIAAIRRAFIKAGVDGARVIHSNQNDAKEVLLSTDVMEHNAVDITVRTSGGR